MALTWRMRHSIVPEQLIDTVLGRLRVRVRGTGEAMLFWPSLLMAGDMWAAQADYFGEQRRVVLVDPPGHGESEKLTAPFTFDDCVRCIVDILDRLGLDRAHFVGNSWGGMIGGTFAARHPDRIGRAVLMNCTASAAGTRQKIEYTMLLRLAQLLGGIRPPLTRSVLKAFLGPTTFSTRPDVVALVRDTVQAVDVSSCAWAVRSVVPRRPDQRELLSRVTTPVLVVAGVEDATFPLTETIAMAEAIPGAAIAVLEGVAHLAALEKPGLVNTLIEEFVFRG
jgi:3-oxoadipate enol-lactonase